MAVDYNRQYVGARYVPTFFKNPDGTWDWAPGFQYEPLTMVKYGENTYTSKQLVPSNVGAPNTNPEYWANTGNYNGAINQINQDISLLFDGDFETPEMHGAKGDGITDDTDAIQAAIDTGRPVRGVGSYLTSAMLIITGKDKSIFLNKIKYTGGLNAVSVSGYRHFVHFQTIESNGNGLTLTGDGNEICENCNIYVGYINAEQNAFYFNGTLQAGEKMHFAQYNVLRGCQWVGKTGGIFVTMPVAEGTWFNSNYFYDLQAIYQNGYGVYLENLDQRDTVLAYKIHGNTFINISCEHSASGYYLKNVQDSLFEKMRTDEIEGTLLSLNGYTTRNSFREFKGAISAIQNATLGASMNRVHGLIFTGQGSATFAEISVGHSDQVASGNGLIYKAESFYMPLYDTPQMVSADLDGTAMTMENYNPNAFGPVINVMKNDITIKVPGNVFNVRCVQKLILYNRTNSGYTLVIGNDSLKIRSHVVLTFNTSGYQLEEIESRRCLSTPPGTNFLSLATNPGAAGKTYTYNGLGWSDGPAGQVPTYIGQVTIMSAANGAGGIVVIFSVNNGGTYIRKCSTTAWLTEWKEFMFE